MTTTPTRRTGRDNPLGTAALAVQALYTVVVAPAFALWVLLVTTECSNSDGPQRFCSQGGQGFVVVTPIAAALIGLLVSVAGHFVWPRRGWAVAVGYLIAFAGFLPSFFFVVAAMT